MMRAGTVSPRQRYRELVLRTRARLVAPYHAGALPEVGSCVWVYSPVSSSRKRMEEWSCARVTAPEEIVGNERGVRDIERARAANPQLLVVVVFFDAKYSLGAVAPEDCYPFVEHLDELSGVVREYPEERRRRSMIDCIRRCEADLEQAPDEEEEAGSDHVSGSPVDDEVQSVSALEEEEEEEEEENGDDEDEDAVARKSPVAKGGSAKCHKADSSRDPDMPPTLLMQPSKARSAGARAAAGTSEPQPALLDPTEEEEEEDSTVRGQADASPDGTARQPSAPVSSSSGGTLVEDDDDEDDADAGSDGMDGEGDAVAETEVPAEQAKEVDGAGSQDGEDSGAAGRAARRSSNDAEGGAAAAATTTPPQYDVLSPEINGDASAPSLWSGSDLQALAEQYGAAPLGILREVQSTLELHPLPDESLTSAIRLVEHMRSLCVAAVACVFPYLFVSIGSIQRAAAEELPPPPPPLPAAGTGTGPGPSLVSGAEPMETTPGVSPGEDPATATLTATENRPAKCPGAAASCAGVAAPAVSNDPAPADGDVVGNAATGAGALAAGAAAGSGLQPPPAHGAVRSTGGGGSDGGESATSVAAVVPSAGDGAAAAAAAAAATTTTTTTTIAPVSAPVSVTPGTHDAKCAAYARRKLLRSLQPLTSSIMRSSVFDKASDEALQAVSNFASEVTTCPPDVPPVAMALDRHVIGLIEFLTHESCAFLFREDGVTMSLLMARAPALCVYLLVISDAHRDSLVSAPAGGGGSSSSGGGGGGGATVGVGHVGGAAFGTREAWQRTTRTARDMCVDFRDWLIQIRDDETGLAWLLMDRGGRLIPRSVSFNEYEFLEVVMAHVSMDPSLALLIEPVLRLYPVLKQLNVAAAAAEGGGGGGGGGGGDRLDAGGAPLAPYMIPARLNFGPQGVIRTIVMEMLYQAEMLTRDMTPAQRARRTRVGPSRFTRGTQERVTASSVIARLSELWKAGALQLPYMSGESLLGSVRDGCEEASSDAISSSSSTTTTTTTVTTPQAAAIPPVIAFLVRVMVIHASSVDVPDTLVEYLRGWREVPLMR